MRPAVRRPTVGLALLTLAALALHLWSTSRVGHPTVAFDEMGYLGNARWLSGRGATWEMPTSPSYAIGYPLVLAPIMRAFGTAAAQWRAVMVTNAVLLATVVPLAFLFARRVLGARARTALLAAAVAGAAPAVVAASPSAIAENLAIPLLLATVLALHRLLGPGAIPARLLFGPAVGFLYLVHARFVLVVGLAVALVAVAAWRRLVPVPVALANGGLLVLVVGAGTALTRTVRRARWDHVERIEGGPGDVLEMLTSRAGLRELAETAVGQAWYLAAGSLGLSVVGVVVLAGRMLRPGAAVDSQAETEVGASAGDEGAAPEVDGDGARRGAPGGERDAVAVPDEAGPLTLAYVLGAGALVFATSVAFFAQTRFRADHLVYGRHNDTFTPLWMAAAVVALLTLPRAAVARLLGIAAVATGGLFAVLSLTRDPGAHGGIYSPFAVPAIIRHVAGDPPGTWWRATLAAAIGLVVVAVLALVARRPALAVVPVIAWSVYSGTGTVSGTARFADDVYRRWPPVAERVRDLGVEGLAIDTRAVDVAYPVLSYGFHLPEVDVTTFDPVLGDQPDQPFVLARADDPTRRAAGDRIALIDRTGYTPFWGAPEGVALWVRPGPETDRLDDEGALLPAGFPAPLPEGARSVRTRLPDDVAGRTVDVEPGGVVELEVQGEHTGSGSPWPDRASHEGRARVRVKARIEALDEGLPDGATSGGELPAWVAPGDGFTTQVGVHALGPMLAPLPEGRYRVTIGVGQDEPGWFAPGGDEATFTLRVTG